MTSITESFGFGFIEAMSYAIPCIAFDSASGARQVIENKELLIKNRNKERMANIIIKLLNDNENLKKQGQESYMICQKYLIDNVKKEWLNLINNIDNKH